MEKAKLILASNSPRRKDLLIKAGMDFEVIPSNYKEEKIEKFDIKSIKKNSLYKALDVAQRINFEAMVIGADTIVILDSVCLLKPFDFKEAFLLLKKLSGREHKVITSVSIVNSKTLQENTQICKTKVWFKKLTDEEILLYLNKFKPYDKAGSYGIQDFVNEKTVVNPPKWSFVKKIEGPYDNVVGLPMRVVKKMLKTM